MPPNQGGQRSNAATIPGGTHDSRPDESVQAEAGKPSDSVPSRHAASRHQENFAQSRDARSAAAGPPSPARPVPSLTEFCVQSLCDHDLNYCTSLEHVPDHLAADMMVRIMQKGRLSPALAYKFQSSTCDEVSAFAAECLQRLHNAQIRAGPVTPKSYGCRF